jgi:signal transduction histidine kinase
MRAGWLEAAIVATLLGSFLTIPIPWAHLALGTAFVVLSGAHLAVRWRTYRAVLRRWHRRAAASGALIGSAAVMTAAGFVQWAGLPAAIGWHSAASLLLVLLAAGHATRRLRRRRRKTGAKWHTEPVSVVSAPTTASRRGERAAVLAAGLVWLALLVFPLLHLAVAAPPAAAMVSLAVVLGTLLLAYLRAVWLIAREGVPRVCWVELAVVVAAAVLLPLLFGGVWFGATVFLAALVGLSYSGWRALAGIGVVTLLAVATGLPSAPAEPQLLSVLLLTPLAGVVIVVVVRQLQLSREVSRLSAEAERLRLARELHDSVKQHAFIAAMEIGAARSGDSGQAEHLEAAAAAVGQVQQRLSGVLDELRPTRGALAPAIRKLTGEWSARTGLPVELELSGCDQTSAEPLLPVAAEALSNVERHAAASAVTLHVHAGELLICDDGAGFDVGAAGHGLAGMRERLTALGGTLDVTSGPDGTTVRARCPR